MSVVLNQNAYKHAQKLIEDGKLVWDEKDLWSEHQPSRDQENMFIVT